MDASRLSLDAGTFGGVVDKGTIDAVLSGGVEQARRICAEAMRVLKPGGKFLVVSNTPGERLLDSLLSMCGPGSACESPLVVSGKGVDDPCVYAYIVRKPISFSVEATSPLDNGRPAWSPSSFPGQRQGLSSATRQDGTLPEAAHESGADEVATTNAGLDPGNCTGVAPSADKAARSGPEGDVALPDVGYDSVLRALKRGDLFDPRKPETRLAQCTAQISQLLREKEPTLLREAGFNELNGDANARLTGNGHAAFLPWGVGESFSEDDLYANYELDANEELSASEVSVDITATRLKICLGPPGARKTVLDNDLQGKVDVTESTWSIQDKTVLNVR